MRSNATVSWSGLVSDWAADSHFTPELSGAVGKIAQYLEKMQHRAGDGTVNAQVAEWTRICRDSLERNDPEQAFQLLQEMKNASPDELIKVMRVISAFFHLTNKAEQHEIARINTLRERTVPEDVSRKESIDEAVAELKAAGRTSDEVMHIFSQLDIQPTITAHPTEARRRTVMDVQDRIVAKLEELESALLTPIRREVLSDDLYAEFHLLLNSDEVRAERLKVEDEVFNGLYFFSNSIWQTIPQIYDDLRLALKKHYGISPELPVILRYRSWIGGDRDGNPNVTPDVTRKTLIQQIKTALRLYLTELDQLRRLMSVSSNLIHLPAEFVLSLNKDAEQINLPETWLRRYRSEPFRAKLMYMSERLQTVLNELERVGLKAVESYPPAQFEAELDLIVRSLKEAGLDEISDMSAIRNIRVRLATFGYHLAALDIREHSANHEAAVAELLRKAGVVDGYVSLSEEQRLAVLEQELRNPRPMVGKTVKLSPKTESVLDVFNVIGEVRAHLPQALGSYVVSMTHSVSDLLEVMLLAKESGLVSLDDKEPEAPFDLVPLFETIDDLKRAGDLTKAMFNNKVYRKFLAARGQFQEVMLGYSDSNKDGGYWMANWALLLAQQHLGETAEKAGIKLRLFHGRGGSVGRGGGRSNQAILSLPPVCQNGSIRFTEQGEVISFRYSLPAITRRHLEQIVQAVIKGFTVREQQTNQAYPAKMQPILEELAVESMKVYRDTVYQPAFWNWFVAITPIEHISQLPIASRPVSRGHAAQSAIDDLRAIPWVFSWTQTRYNLPGWFGVGKALETAISDPETKAFFQKSYKEWPFFKAIVNNVHLELARTDLITAESYQILTNKSLHAVIAEEFERTVKAILVVSELDNLLDMNTVVQRSIAFRNPFTLVLNLIQVALLKRWKERQQDDPALRHGLFLSINGVAAAMQSTG